MTPFSSFSSRAALSLSQVSERPNKSLAPHSKDFKDGFIGINDVGRRLGLGGLPHTGESTDSLHWLNLVGAFLLGDYAGKRRKRVVFWADFPVPQFWP
jgi:hypothetical protein